MATGEGRANPCEGAGRPPGRGFAAPSQGQDSHAEGAGVPKKGEALPSRSPNSSGEGRKPDDAMRLPPRVPRRPVPPQPPSWPRYDKSLAPASPTSHRAIGVNPRPKSAAAPLTPAPHAHCKGARRQSWVISEDTARPATPLRREAPYQACPTPHQGSPIATNSSRNTC